MALREKTAVRFVIETVRHVHMGAFVAAAIIADGLRHSEPAAGLERQAEPGVAHGGDAFGRAGPGAGAPAA